MMILSQSRTALSNEMKLRFSWGLVWHPAPSPPPLPPRLPGRRGAGGSICPQVNLTPQTGLVQRPVRPTMRPDVINGAHTRISSTSAFFACQSLIVPFHTWKRTAIERRDLTKKMLKREDQVTECLPPPQHLALPFRTVLWICVMTT